MEEEIKILIENDDGTTAPPEHIIQLLVNTPNVKTPETEPEEL